MESLASSESKSLICCDTEIQARFVSFLQVMMEAFPLDTECNSKQEITK